MGKAMRTSISVPPELKARMDAVDESVNWSAVACRAFEEKLAEITARKRDKDMGDVVARLRASKKKMESGRFASGHEAGARWARETAEAEELIRLQDLRERLRDDEWDYNWATDNGSAYGPGECFYFTIHPEGDGDRHGAAAFWDEDGEMMHDSDYVRGFAEGALEIWNAVKDEI